MIYKLYMRKINEIYLNDVLRSIKKIETYIHGMTIKTFLQDEKTRDAVIRNIEIIGEAINRLPTEFFRKYPKFPSREAISMRNFLIHDYSNIISKVVWKTIKKDIPALKKQIMKIQSGLKQI